MKRFGLLSLVLLAVPDAALACGGFFCDPGPIQSTAINQNAERIVFVRHETSISAYIQIRYEGTPADFAWVVPVVSRPELDVADPAMFDALDQATQPKFRFPPPSQPSGGGGGGGGGFGCMGASEDKAMSAGGDDGGDADGDADGGVNVWGQDNVGPYSTAIITADDPADLTTWLMENDYAIPEEANGVISQYVAEGSFFVAVRLQASATTDLLQPLVITYEGDEPCVPLRLTQVAAVPDMGVLVWIVSDEPGAQAYPYNYSHVQIDMDEVDLAADGTNNYYDLVRGSLDGVGGHGFVTEYAGPTSGLPDLSQPQAYYYGGDPGGSVEAEEIVNAGAYITRLYTEIDPQEMTLDPIFQFDADLADVSNVHDFTNRTAAAGIRATRVRYAAIGSGILPLAIALGISWRSRRRSGAA